MNTQKEKTIEEIKRNIPKRNIFKEDKEVIASDYYYWKDVYNALDESYKAGKAKVIELGNELIEEYFDKPSSVFWDRLKGELTTK